jgi:O-antigen ligase
MTPLLASGAVIVLLAVSAAAPELSLLAFAGFFAIAPAICAGLLGWPARAAAVLALPVAVGVLRRPRGSVPAGFFWSALAFLTVVLCSVAVQTVLTAVVIGSAGFAAEALAFARGGFLDSGAFGPMVAALPTIAGIAFALAVARAAADDSFRRRFIRMLLAGGAAVAALNIARLAGAVLRTGTPWAALPEALTHLRISAPHGDPNATGSFFALLLPIAVTIAIRSRGRERAAHGAVAAMLALALWMTGSRAALIAVVLVAAAVAPWRPLRGSGRARAIGAAALVLIGFAAWLSPNSLLDLHSSGGALRIRAELARVALDLWRTDPALGVGIGRFVERSRDVMRDPYVVALYGRGENAHNNFLQVLAELGLAGALAFALVLVTALRQPSAEGLRRGLAAFLITCLSGHPLLVPDVTFAFWLVAGAAAGGGAAAPPTRLPRLAKALIAAALVLTPVSYHLERGQLSLEHVGYGVSGWLTDGDGRRYRRSEGQATIFVARTARQLTVSVRAVPGAALPVSVELSLNGRRADTLRLRDEAWQRHRFTMPTTAGPAFIPLQFAAVDAHGRPTPFLLEKIDALY